MSFCCSTRLRSVITAANIIIVVVLHRTSYDWRTSNDSNKRESDLSVRKKKLLKPSLRQSCSGTSTTTAAELVLATKRRTNAQVTRMLLAVTLSVIIFNIPNTIFYVGLLIFGEKAYLHNRSFVNMSKDNIAIHKTRFYSEVIKDILLNLPYVVNFFLYCLAGKKFRSIFINEIHQLLIDFHLIEQKERHRIYGTSPLNPNSIQTIGYSRNVGCMSPKTSSSQVRQSVEVLFNGKNALTILNRQNESLSKQEIYRSNGNQKCVRSCTREQ
ncbi:unnamed protein product [Rotaria sp. Silwood2]|nr:unnamed protein product [Rotaria sp. Silwood2]